MDQLAFPPGGGLTLIVAPTGSGKTSLVSQWLQNVECKAQSVEQPNSECAAPVPRSPVCALRSAWLSLDEDDNDPRRFWRHLFAALEPALPKLAESWALLQRLEAADLGAAAIIALIEQLADANRPICLILDDYHSIRDGNDAIHGAMTRLITQQPAQLHLIIASRSEPPLPLMAHHRRLAVADLAFRVDEADALVAQALGVAAPPTTLSAIVSRTEGWAAGVRLAALVLGEGQALTGVAAAFGGS
ncbi:MAG: AAA family ATPase, partial [Chloroflexaceae bacterium]